MLGWSVHTVVTQNQLVVTDPISILAVVMAILFLCGPLAYVLYNDRSLSVVPSSWPSETSSRSPSFLTANN